jgi:hypothetical protein
MTQDRMIIREEEEAAKAKKSRFSLFSRKSSTPSTPSKVSRPPGPSTFSSKPSMDMSRSLADDELPERMENTHISTPPKTPTVAESEKKQDVADVVDKTVPVHAGFDFKAITQALKEGSNPVDAQDEASKPVLAPIVVSSMPLVRSESAPPLDQSSPETAATPKATWPPSPFSATIPKTAPVVEPPAPPVPHHVLSRSLSSEVGPSTDTSGMSPTGSFAPWTFSQKNSWSTRNASEVTLGNTGVWGSEASVSAPYKSNGFQPSTASLSFGGSDGSISLGPALNATSSTPFSSTTHKPFEDKFGFGGAGAGLSFGSSDGTISTAPAPTLSFGGADGSISLASSNKERDQWAPKPWGSSNTQKSNPFASNPWDS